MSAAYNGAPVVTLQTGVESCDGYPYKSCKLGNPELLKSGFRVVAQPGSVRRSGRRGRRFESCLPDLKNEALQMFEFEGLFNLNNFEFKRSKSLIALNSNALEDVRIHFIFQSSTANKEFSGQERCVAGETNLRSVGVTSTADSISTSD